MSKQLWSVFTNDMEHCYFTGTPYCHRHHIFYGPYRSMSEKYGFVIPIAYYLHENYPDSVHQNPKHSPSVIYCTRCCITAREPGSGGKEQHGRTDRIRGLSPVIEL